MKFVTTCKGECGEQYFVEEMHTTFDGHVCDSCFEDVWA